MTYVTTPIEDRPSQNYTPGRNMPISKIIIHHMNGTLAACDSVFANPASQVSAHFGVGEGQIHRYVNNDNMAWHAISANSFGIGIETSGDMYREADDWTYETVAQICADLCEAYDLNPWNDIEPHQQYVATQCPGLFNLDRLKNRVSELLGGAQPAKNVEAKPVPLESYQVRVKQDVAFYRKSPRQNGEELGTFKKGQALDFKGYVEAEDPYATGQNRWYVGKHTGGFIWEGALEEPRKNTSLKKISAQEPKQDVVVQKRIGQYSANYRAEPQANSGVKSVFQPGSEVNVKGYVTGWDPYNSGQNKWAVGAFTGGFIWEGNLVGGVDGLPQL